MIVARLLGAALGAWRSFALALLAALLAAFAPAPAIGPAVPPAEAAVPAAEAPPSPVLCVFLAAYRPNAPPRVVAVVVLHTSTRSAWAGDRGMWFDGGSTGMYKTQTRFYQPGLGRFTQVDPIRAGNNWYAYCDGDPVNRADPSGLNYVWNSSTSAWDEDIPFNPNVPRPHGKFRPEDNGGKGTFRDEDVVNYSIWFHSKAGFVTGFYTAESNADVGWTPTPSFAALQDAMARRFGQLPRLAIQPFGPRTLAAIDAAVSAGGEAIARGISDGAQEFINDNKETISQLTSDPGEFVSSTVEGLKIALQSPVQTARAMAVAELDKIKGKIAAGGIAYAVSSVAAYQALDAAVSRGMGKLRKAIPGGGGNVLTDRIAGVLARQIDVLPMGPAERKRIADLRAMLQNSDLNSANRRKFADGGRGVVAAADLEIGGSRRSFHSFSGEANLDGFSPPIPESQRVLKTTIADGGGAYPRVFDAEAKLLEDVIRQTEPGTGGVLRLVVDRDACTSCQSVIQAFQIMRPNITLQLVQPSAILGR